MPAQLTSNLREVADFLSEARDRYEYGLRADSIDRQEAKSDNVFANASDSDLGQWSEPALGLRKKANRPLLQWNRIPTYVQQVVNDGRQNKPAIKIAAADGGKKETADFFQSRIRHIEYESNADIAYDTARDQQVTSGRGFIRISTEYVPGTFKQRICIEPIEDQFTVVWDPAAKLYDKSDAEWWFIVSRISKAQHIRDYGKESIVSRMDFVRDENPAPNWIAVGEKSELVQVAEYWRKEYKLRTLCLLGSPDSPEGQVEKWKDELTDQEYADLKAKGFIAEERDEQHATVVQQIINGAEILRPNGGRGPDKTEWIGPTIPIVPVWGRCAVVDGLRRTFSLIRNAKDPQRLVNLYVSNIAEMVAMMPKAPLLAPIGSIPANLENTYQQVSGSPVAWLLYRQYDDQGRLLERPERIISEPPIQALTIALQQSIDAIKAAMGIFDASLGARSNETSGIAIQRRQKESDVANFHFPDNEQRSRKRIGEILIEIIPLIDKPGSSVPVRFENGDTKLVPVGVPFKDDKTGQETTHILTDGDYGVVAESGPSYDSARKETADKMASFITAAPETLWVFGDEYLALLDVPGAELLAERMKRAIQIKTPQLIDPEGQTQQIPPQVQAKFDQQSQLLQQTQAFAQSLHEQIQTKKPEIDSKERMHATDSDLKLKELDVQRLKIATDARVALAKLGITVDQMRLEKEVDVLLSQAELAHEKDLHTQKLAAAAGVQAADHGQEQQMQSADQEHAQELQEGQQAHQSDLADQQQQGALAQQEQAAKLAPKPAAGGQK